MSLPQPELLTRSHVCADFECGEADINHYLIAEALRDGEAGLSRTWVIARAENRSVQGFVSLSATSQQVRIKVPGKQGKKAKQTKLLPGSLASIPYPEAPMILLGRLGVETACAGQGIGTRLLIFAIEKTLRISNEIGVAGIVLDAMTDDLLDYYRKMKFERLPYPDPRKRRMLLTLADVRATKIASLG
jgi:GNAT superfamily N-acetyltransferase